LKTKWYKVLLFIEWEQFWTLEFAKFIEENELKYSNLVFIIWWAYWVNINLLEKYINFKLSLSSMTFPHSQAIMILLEQIYRVVCMKKGIAYHHF
jgi:23S rRNA (pseudouridine1915-N3)-methyltransferase